MSEFLCALTFVESTADTILGDDMPIGWVRVTIERQHLNPEWVQIQQFKESATQQEFAKIADAVSEEQRPAVYAAIQLQIRASFAALEATVDRVISEVQEVLIAPPESDSDIAEALAEARDLLGFDDDDIPDFTDDAPAGDAAADDDDDDREGASEGSPAPEHSSPAAGAAAAAAAAE
jgi:hypothetical protein